VLEPTAQVQLSKGSRKDAAAAYVELSWRVHEELGKLNSYFERLGLAMRTWVQVRTHLAPLASGSLGQGIPPPPPPPLYIYVTCGAARCAYGYFFGAGLLQVWQESEAGEVRYVPSRRSSHGAALPIAPERAARPPHRYDGMPYLRARH